MAVTHADLTPTRKSSDLGSKTGVFLMVLSILLGLCCFILCLIAEATRSELVWEATNGKEKSECAYTGNGKLPLLSATGAFFALATALIVQHTFLLVAVSKSDAILEITWEKDSFLGKTFNWQAGFFFVATWTSFTVGEILLLIGVSVESGHLKNWAEPRTSCLIIHKGLFTAAGVFGLLTVFWASDLYITALRAETLFQEQENSRREVLEVSTMALYSSPTRINLMNVPNENTLPRPDQNFQALDKDSIVV